MADFINVGFGNMVNGDKIISMVSTDAAPIKRMIRQLMPPVDGVQEQYLSWKADILFYLPSRQIHYLRDAIANAMMRMRK